MLQPQPRRFCPCQSLLRSPVTFPAQPPRNSFHAHLVFERNLGITFFSVLFPLWSLADLRGAWRTQVDDMCALCLTCPRPELLTAAPLSLPVAIPREGNVFCRGGSGRGPGHCVCTRRRCARQEHRGLLQGGLLPLPPAQAWDPPRCRAGLAGRAPPPCSAWAAACVLCHVHSGPSGQEER